MAWRPLLLVCGSALFFALTLEGLGLPLTTFATLLIAASASPQFRPAEALLTAAAALAQADPANADAYQANARAYLDRIEAALDRACDLVLVGDSLGMVLHGLPSTVGVTMEMMILHG